MGFYIRKSFRAGPIRFNLSKGGLGMSAGVKGARVGAGPRGSYVHGGRHGVYYRKYMSGSTRRSGATADGSDIGVLLLLAVIAIGLGIWGLVWLLARPWLLATAVTAAIAIPAVRWELRRRRKQRCRDYRNLLMRTFVHAAVLPSESTLAAVRTLREDMPRHHPVTRDIEEIEADVHQAVLSKILDNGSVSNDDANLLGALEAVLRLDSSKCLEAKKEIFSAAYLEAIADHQITDWEMRRLHNLCSGLGIPETAVQDEMRVVEDIARAQQLDMPLETLPRNALLIKIQNSENAYHQAQAQILTRRASRTRDAGHDYTVKRDGVMVLTQKRLLVVDKGTTSIPYDDIADVEYDIDLGLITISKSTSSRPVFLGTESPIWTARAIDLLADAARERS